MNKFHVRQYEAGDEVAINNLYFEITGRKRSLEQYFWQWHNAPGGSGEIWLIEMIKPDGKVKLIGHHGLMPIVFSYGKYDLLAGKTENTMVLPEYRRKILYPKYENFFLMHYKKRFDLLFSTFGSPAATRLRLSLGYEASAKWLNCCWHLGLGAAFSRLAFTFSSPQKNKISKITALLCSNIGSVCNKLFPFQKKTHATIPLQALPSDVAQAHPFFKEFWNVARHAYGITPRRNHEDLLWRFWKNPYGVHTTLLCDGSKDGDGYAIVRDLGNQNFRLEDIVIYPLDHSFLINMLNAICEWVHKNGGNILRFNTVADENNLTCVFQKFSQVNVPTKFSFIWRKQPDQFMPRKLTGKSNVFNNNDPTWFITPFIKEGRL
jgi:hypothetical protein